MENGIEQYDILINGIEEYTKELAEINNQIEKIKLSKEEEKEVKTIVDAYDSKIPMSEYIDSKSKSYKENTKIYKYLELYKRGYATNEELTELVNYVASLKII